MVCINLALLSVEETSEVVEEVLKYNTDDIYRVLDNISDKLSGISSKLDGIQETGTDILKYLQSSKLDYIVALLLILVGFEIMRLVKGWTKGGKYIGHNN